MRAHVDSSEHDALSPSTIPLDADVIRGFQELALRSGSEDYASLIHAVLRDYLRRSGEPLERTLRRVLREELRKAG
ncbi:MAG TPA: hypothetical protein VMT92_04130 [Steroidobacteraceae bacterium]|nr:hypothetical protein [Steroidobacteraceae bacterium]